MFNVENLQFFFKIPISQKLRMMATNGLLIPFQRTKTYEKRQLNVTSPDDCRTVLQYKCNCRDEFIIA